MLQKKIVIVFVAILCGAMCLAESAICQDLLSHTSSSNEAERIAEEIGISPASMILEEDGCIRC